MKRLHPFDRDMIVVILIGAVLFYLTYKFFPMQPPSMKGY